MPLASLLDHADGLPSNALVARPTVVVATAGALGAGPTP